MRCAKHRIECTNLQNKRKAMLFKSTNSENLKRLNDEFLTEEIR
jgi:hypothetical protein